MVGQVSGSGSGREVPPPGAGHRPCLCASAGCVGQPLGSSASSSAASDAPQGPEGNRHRDPVRCWRPLSCPFPVSSPQGSFPPRIPFRLPQPTHHLAGRPVSHICSQLMLWEDEQGAGSLGFKPRQSCLHAHHSSCQLRGSGKSLTSLPSSLIHTWRHRSLPHRP